MGKELYTASQFIQAIPGTGGIISAIAKRVGCDWDTAKKYIDKYPTIQQAYDNECEAVTDISESVLTTNIKAAQTVQSKAIQEAQKLEEEKKYKEAARKYREAIVDSADAKWWLTRKGKARGFGDSTEITGQGGGAVEISITEWHNNYEQRRKQIEEAAKMLDDDTSS